MLPLSMDEVARAAELVPHGIKPHSLPFTTVGDLFIFIGLIVCIGSIGVYAIYRLIRECFYGD